MRCAGNLMNFNGGVHAQAALRSAARRGAGKMLIVFYQRASTSKLHVYSANQ